MPDGRIIWQGNQPGAMLYSVEKSKDTSYITAMSAEGTNEVNIFETSGAMR